MANNWFTDVWVDGVDVNKSTLRTGLRDYVAMYASLAELQAMTAANVRLAIVHIAGTDFESYRYDSTDTTTADDAFNTIVTADGKRYKRVIKSRTEISANHATRAGLKVTQLGAANVVEFHDSAGDASPAVYTGDGRFVVGHNAPITFVGSVSPTIQVIGVNASSATFGNAMFSTSVASGAQSYFLKSRGANRGDQGNLSAGDGLGGFQFIGSDGAAFINGATLNVVCDTAPGASSGEMFGSFVFATRNGTAAVADRMKLTSAGDLGVGTTTPSTKLHVNGPVRCASYTVATVPSASSSGAGAQIYVSNETGGAVMAFSDATNWRRVTDRAVIA